MSPEIVIAEVLEALEARIDAFSVGGESTVEELRQYDALLGKLLRLGQEEGFARGINRSGSLLLQSTEGVVKEVNGGHVVVVTG